MFKILCLLTVASTAFGGCWVNKNYFGSVCQRAPFGLTVTNNACDLSVSYRNCNALYNKLDWEDEPTVRYAYANYNKSYTLVMVDPDAPGYADGEYYLHWMVSNIHGRDFAKGDLSKADHLVPYDGPDPPENSGLHRYIFLLFEQEQYHQNVTAPEELTNFNLVSWIESQPKDLCGPAGGMQFRSTF